MATGATGQLGLALPVQGELSGTWGDTVNNGITQYTNIAIAATLTLTNDGAVTLANTTGDASASNITSSLTGAGTVTAQFAIVRVTGTLTTAKVVTAPSYSKTYTVVNAATGGIVTFKASGQTGVSIAVGESAFVYFNGTDYVKVSGTTSGAAGGSNTQVQFNSSGALAGSANLTFDGTNLGLAGGTANGVPYLNGSKVLTSGSGLVFDASNLGVGVTPSAWDSTYKAIQVGARSMFYGIGSEANMANNAYYNAGYKYVATSAAGLYTIDANVHKWYSAASGTAGNAITFTQALTLDSAGYLSGVWADEVSALGNSGTATTITCTAGNVFTATLTGNCTFTLASPSTTTANTATSFTLILTNDGTAGRTVAWAGGTFLWPGGAASLSRTTTANATDIWFFFSPNGGTTWYGNISQKNLIA
jgi:hypothetical protein